MYMCVLPPSLSTTCVWYPRMSKENIRAPGNRAMGGFKATMWVLGAEPMSSSRATRAPNC